MIRSIITRWVDLWEIGLHAGLVRYAQAGETDREGRHYRGGEVEDENLGRKFHRAVMSGNVR